MVRIELVSHCDVVSDLVELFNVVFSTEMSIEMWEWKHMQNPLNPAQPKVVVAIDDGKIVGARPFMLANLKVHNRTLLAGQPCDTMVHPEYRRQGIFAKMNHLAIEHAREIGSILLYNFPNQYSGAGNLKQGWQKVMPCVQLMRFQNPVEVARPKFGKGVGSAIIGRSYGLLFGRTPRRRHYDEAQTWRIEVSSKAVDKLEGLSQLYQQQYIELDRSLSYLEWRVDSHPRHEYRYVMCLEDERLVAYVLVGLSTTRNGLRVGRIVDYIVGPGNSDCICAMFDRAVLEMMNMGCDMLSTWVPVDGQIRGILEHMLAFKSTLDFPLRLAFRGEPLWLMVRETDVSSPRRDPCIHDPAVWRLTPLFSDTV